MPQLSRLIPLTLLPLLFLFTGCGESSTDAPSGAGTKKGLTEVVLQTDWMPQPEHGGFYQAVAKGFYREEGLDVTLLPGGPNTMSVQKILRGRVDFAMNRADAVYTFNQRDVPAIMVMATLQHDPQSVMLHATNPIDSLPELDGESVMAIPGLSWIQWVEARYGIKLNIVPHDFGMERFLEDPTFIQQCLLTNEPFYIRKAGVEPKVIPLRESGFDPYHGIYCLRSFAEGKPETVRRFVRASVRGWKDFIHNDPAPAFAMIAERNSRMTPEFMAFSRGEMVERRLVTGKKDGSDDTGQLDPERLENLAKRLHELGIAKGDPAAAPEWYTTRFLPD